MRALPIELASRVVAMCLCSDVHKDGQTIMGENAFFALVSELFVVSHNASNGLSCSPSLIVRNIWQLGELVFQALLSSDDVKT